MRHVFDLSGNGSRRFQFFPDAVAAFAIPTTIEETLSLLVWGVVFPEPQGDAEFCQHLPFTVRSSLPTALYLSGWGVLTFHGVQRGEVSVWPYEPTFQLQHLTFPPGKGDELPPLSQSWSGPAQGNGIDYLISMILEHPLGFMALKVVASGAVTFAVNPTDFVTEEQLDKLPDRYRFDLTRTRQLTTSINRTNQK